MVSRNHYKKTKKYGATARFHRIFGRGDGIWTHDLRVPNATRYQLRYASIFQFFIYFRKWSNMWSSHLFRTFCRKVYRPNCQVCQGVQRFSKITASRPVAVSRTRRATSCATPRFFSFLSIFVSGQTCGQATYFERFVEKCTARIVRFFKGFSDFEKSLLRACAVAPQTQRNKVVIFSL